MAEQKKEEKAGAAEIQLVIFFLAGEEFGIETSQVREIIRMQDITPMPRAPEFIEGVINLRGQIIAVMDLVKKFGIEKNKKTNRARIVIAEFEDNSIGLIVDAVPEVIRISEKDIDPTPKMLETRVHSDFIKGVGKLEDRLIVLLDIGGIFTNEEALQVTEATKQETE